jgi:hypothetical protein
MQPDTAHAHAYLKGKKRTTRQTEQRRREIAREFSGKGGLSRARTPREWIQAFARDGRKISG